MTSELSTAVLDSLPDATAVVDEFALLARRGSPEAVGQLGHQVAAVLAEPHLVHGTLLSVPGSVGVTLAAAGEPAAVVMRRADEAMYAVKRARSCRTA